MPTVIVGPVTVPDVDDPGTTQATAEAAIEAAYLSVETLTAYSATVPAGEVISQDPAANTEVDPYTTVTLTVSLGLFVGGNAFSGAMCMFFRRRH